jgi:AhpD family alkylhydroperoxidase
LAPLEAVYVRPRGESRNRAGALTGKTKELLGLVALAVLRCNDCIDCHLIQCVLAGYAGAELHDALNIALIGGGSIVIPHLRHAYETIGLLREELPDRP